MAPFDSTTFEAPLSTPATANGRLDAQGNEVNDREMMLTMPRVQEADAPNGTGPAGGGGAGGTPAQRPYAFTRNSSGFGSFLNYANTPTTTTERARPATPAYSATRSTVFDAPNSVSESPTSTNPPQVESVGAFSTSPASASATTTTTNGTPALAKLEFPNDSTVLPTNRTLDNAKPRPKGRGTLELERVLGLWAAKTPTSSFSGLPSLSSINPSSPSATSTPTSGLPLFGQNIVSSEPESFVPTSSTSTNAATSIPAETTSSDTNSFPSFGESRERSSRDSLAPPAFGPRRRRSKSDTDIMRGDSLGFPHSNLPVGPYVDPPPIVSEGPTFSSNVAPPTPTGAEGPHHRFAMDPNETWRSPPPPSTPSYTTNPVLALDLGSNPNQRELASRNRSTHFNRNHRDLGGPGYHEAAFLDVPGDGGRSRRARSQGAGHRPSRSDDFSHLLPSMQQSISQPILTTSSNGLLAPPTQAQARPPAQVQSQAPPPVPSPVSQSIGSPYQQNASNSPLPPPSAAQHSFHAYPHLPHPPPSSSQNPAYPPHLQYSQGPPPPPDQGYLANQAALLASAALIAFNPGDPAHAAAAAAGYLPPSYPPHLPNHPYNAHYGSPYGAPPPGLPPLPQTSQLPYPPPRSASGHPHPNLPGSGGGGGVARSHPSFTYHSPLNQLPSPPSTSKSHSPAASGSGYGSATRTSGRARRQNVTKHDLEEEGDEDESMRMDEEEGAIEGQEGEEEAQEEDEDDDDGRSSTTTTSAKGKGKKGTKGKGRGKRQVSEEGFSEKSKTTQATIDAAKRRRNANAVAKFVCDLCGETFTRRYNLRGHQRAHNGEKPYKCSYEGCDKAFARAHDCKRHELLHLGVRKYHCSPCNRDFVRLDALHRHHRSEVGQACVKQLEAEGYVFDEKGAAVSLQE
ncbi:C2H2-type zinc finger protein [Sporobolomyces salmoneus]|uniref:C2H2-type zinc finger protein n=1 Tax=Sporobolomyces salmoneus TaxID=183962 RepID=UPI00316E0D94